MSRFAVEARIVVESRNRDEAIAKADQLAAATMRSLAGRGFELHVTGRPEEIPAESAATLCESCGARRHDGEPCKTERVEP